MTDEFIDSYSDDILYLQEIKRILDTRSVSFCPVKQLYVPFLCRLFALVMVSSLEHMLKQWKHNYTGCAIFDVYLSKKKCVSNKTRVEDLRRAFEDAGVATDPGVFEDYLAIKYLRNTIVHTKWSNDKKHWVESRGLPTNVMQFEEEHFDKMSVVNEKMMQYIALVPFVHRNGGTDRDS